MRSSQGHIQSKILLKKYRKCIFKAGYACYNSIVENVSVRFLLSPIRKGGGIPLPFLFTCSGKTGRRIEHRAIFICVLNNLSNTRKKTT